MGKRTLIQVIYPLLKLYWFFVRPKTFGVQCVIQQGDAILLVRNTYGRKQWTFPGGSIARGESAEAAIRREVREEVSLPLQQLQHLGAFDATIDYKKDECTRNESRGKVARDDGFWVEGTLHGW
jgi:8-oxo-dGTP pyrophosphatase MutT (NUDIX family)